MKRGIVYSTTQPPGSNMLVKLTESVNLIESESETLLSYPPGSNISIEKKVSMKESERS